MSSKTPMMRHYLELKQQHPDALLFYRCGDFYELFFDDAATAAAELDLVLTSRDKSSDNPVPMAGVPHHAAVNYINRLLEKGHKVAVCEQLEDPKAAKGMVRRGIVRIVTPGTTLDVESLDAEANNYLAAIWLDPTRLGEGVGLAVLDLSTGEFRLTQVSGVEELQTELVRLQPTEAILPESLKKSGIERPWSAWARPCYPNWESADAFDPTEAETRLVEHFHVESLAALGIDKLQQGARAAGALLGYVQRTQMQDASHVLSLKPYFLSDYLQLDESTKLNLELERTLIGQTKRGSLFGVLDLSRTALGARTLRRWLNYPLVQPKAIQARLARVAEYVESGVMRGDLRDILRRIGDLQRIAGRISLNQSTARDLVALASSLEAVAELRLFAQAHESTLLFQDAAGLDALDDLQTLLAEAIVDDPPATTREGGMFKKGFHAELDELVSLQTDAKQAIAALETEEKKRSGLTNLRIKYNRVFGYFIELAKSQAERAPAEWTRRQTLTNVERFITPELKEFEDKVLGAQEKRIKLEEELFEQMRREVAERFGRLMGTAEIVGRLDALSALGELAMRERYVRPEVDEDDEILIEEGRHPVIEKVNRDERFIPNDLRLDNRDHQVLLLTGPNMAGKSTVMRQAALIVILAQMGSFVPASRAKIGVVDRVFTRVGASDNLARGLSTFMVEMTETAAILERATPRSLVVLDEIGRGTSTFDGLSIAWAVAEYIHDQIGAKTLFATHYHELTELAITKARVQNYNIAVKEYRGEIIFLRKLVAGATNRSYGIQVGKLAGLPQSVVGRAKEVLKELERGEFGKNRVQEATAGATKQAATGQLSFFGPRIVEVKEPSPVEEEIEALDLDTLTPLEAMNHLWKWRERLKKEKKENS